MTEIRNNILQWSVRLIILAAAIFFALPGPLPIWIAKLFPAMSPFAALNAAITDRGWRLGLLWLIPSLILILLAAWKGRLFCKWVCPLGTFYAIPAKLTCNQRLLTMRFHGYLFWIIIAASILAAPVILFLDPLATTNRIVNTAVQTHELKTHEQVYPWIMWILGLIVPLFLMIGFIQPKIWCTHLCPLGYCFDLAFRLRHNTPRTFNRSRREILAGLAIGLPMGLILKRFGLPRTHADALPILPPGAQRQDIFSAVCSRCYQCISVCPTNVLRIASPAKHKIGQFFQPELDTNSSYCDEFCNQCSQVCHTGAILPLSPEKKKYRKIGTAVVDRTLCIAWEYNGYCMVCQEYCPYKAIETRFNDHGIPCPEVKPDVCRGCGACQKGCPSGTIPKAITVTALLNQIQIAPSS